MPYCPDWETLNEALCRLVAAGEIEAQAKTDLCKAIADRKISLRVILRSPRGVEIALIGADVALPPRLDPEAFDWHASRPCLPWERHATVADRYFPTSRQINVHSVEVRRDDVTRILSGAEITKQQAPRTAAQSVKRPGRPTRKPDIEDALRDADLNQPDKVLIALVQDKLGNGRGLSEDVIRRAIVELRRRIPER